MGINSVLRFMQLQLERVNGKEIAGATARNFLKSIKLYIDLADIPIAWKKISRGLPKGKSYADDRIPTIIELQKILDYPDRRIRSIVITMASSGIRLGAWDFLKWGHVIPITKNDEVIAAKIVVYAGEDEEILKEWLHKCKTVEKLTYNPSIYIKNGLRHGGPYKPPKLDTLKQE